MEIVKNFGIEPVLLLAQVINFLVILFILKRFLYKPVIELLKKRQDSIKDGIKKTEEAQTKLENIIRSEKSILENAKNKAKKIIEDASFQSQESAKEILENTKRHSEKIVNEARMQIREEAKETEKRLTSHISNLAVKFLQKSVESFFSENQQKEVIANALKKMKV